MNPILANIAHGRVGQTLRLHTPAGLFAGTLEAVIGGGLARLRGGGTVYDVDLAHVVAVSYPAPAPAYVAAPPNYWVVTSTTTVAA